MSSKISEFWSLPEPAREELGCSVVARFLESWGYLDRRHLLEQIFGFVVKSSHSICVPSVPMVASKALRDQENAAARFIRGHSLLPYFLGYIAPADTARIESLLTSTERIPLARAINMSALTWGAPKCLRLCEQCYASEVDGGIAPVWHRKHQLPGISRCATHGGPLWNTVAPFGSDIGLQFPTVRKAAELPREEVDPAFTSDFESDVAEESHKLLIRGLAHDTREMKSRFRGVLHQVGYLGRSNEVRATSLASDLERWLLQRGTSLERLGVGPWWLRFSTDLRGTPTPLQAIVIRLFLESRLKAFDVPCPDMFGFDLDAAYDVKPSRYRIGRTAKKETFHAAPASEFAGGDQYKCHRAGHEL